MCGDPLTRCLDGELSPITLVVSERLVQRICKLLEYASGHCNGWFKMAARSPHYAGLDGKLTHASEILLPIQVSSKVGNNHAWVKTQRHQSLVAELLGQRHRHQHIGGLRLSVCTPFIVCCALLEFDGLESRVDENGVFPLPRRATYLEPNIMEPNRTHPESVTGDIHYPRRR